MPLMNIFLNMVVLLFFPQAENKREVSEL